MTTPDEAAADHAFDEASDAPDDFPPLDPEDLATVAEASSAFEADVIAAAVRARGVPAIAVALPPSDIPTSDAGRHSVAVIMAPRDRVAEAREALADARAEGDEARNAQPDSDEADYTRLHKRRQQRLVGWALRVLVAFFVMWLMTFRPLAGVAFVAIWIAVEFVARYALSRPSER